MSKLGMKKSVRPDSETIALQPNEKLLSVFNQVRDELVSTLWYVLGNADDAHDAAQEAFLKCWRAQESLVDVQNMRAWIFRVGLNVARDHQRSAWYRRSKPMSGDNMAIASNEKPAAETIEGEEALAQLRQAIMNLRQDEKEVFLLRQNGEMTFEQIAEARRSPLGTVKTQMRSALHKLKQILNDNE